MAMKQSQKTLALWLVIILVSISVLHFMSQKPQGVKEISFSEFLEAAKVGNVAEVSIQGEEYTGKFKEAHDQGAYFVTVGPIDSQKPLDLLSSTDAKVEYKRPKETPFWQSFLISWLPMLLLFGFFFFSMRQIQVGPGKAMSFGRSKARMLTEDKRKVTFADVAGIDEAKEELQEIIEFLKTPKKFTKLGGRIPKGVLLLGSPGCGKTLLARAVAGEAGVPFFSISGSDFVEMFVGVGASRVRDLFEQGKKNAPCIVFIDEIDAVGRHRGAGLGGGHDEREQTLNQLLVEMDGFESNEGVIIMAATNRPEILDPALLRPGRFDRHVVVDRPDIVGREEILKIHTKSVKLSPGVDLRVIASRTPGFVGADLANIINEAALLAARKNKEAVEMTDIEEAIDRVIAGLEKKRRLMSKKEKEIVAFHEAGHALMASTVPNADPVRRISIIPRGISALGYTLQLPTEDRYLMTRSELLDRLAVLLGGRVSEEIIFGEISTGAHNDLQRATDIATSMVKEYGMSEALGYVTFEKEKKPFFLPPTLTSSKEYSEETARKIDEEVKKIIDQAYHRTKEILQGKKDKLEELARFLLEKEVVEEADLKKILHPQAEEFS